MKARHYCEYESPLYRDIVKEMSDKKEKSGALKELKAAGYTKKNMKGRKRGRFSLTHRR
tara:strand:- start:204 stop:380 length:177 start_codon:yes stop_codon:yes gene_type:complete